MTSYKIKLIILIIAISIGLILVVTLLSGHFKVQLNTISYLVIFLVGISVLYSIVINYVMKRINRRSEVDSKKKYDLLHVIVILSIGLTLLIALTVETEYIPISSFQETTKFNNSSFQNITKFNNVSVVIESPSIFLIPIKSVFNPVKEYVNVSIYNLPEKVKIESVKLFSTAYSFITIPHTELKEYSNKSKHYSTIIEAKHNGEIFSINNTYTVNVNLNDTNNNQLYYNSIPFELKVRSLDMSIVTYFWIVMIGVVVSRFISFVLTELNTIERARQEGKGLVEIKELKDNILKIDEREALWIIFSFIISILLFSGFKETLNDLTTVVLFNISLAFGFGFAFDRTLELATRFKSIYTQE